MLSLVSEVSPGCVSQYVLVKEEPEIVTCSGVILALLFWKSNDALLSDSDISEIS